MPLWLLALRCSLLPPSDQIGFPQPRYGSSGPIGLRCRAVVRTTAEPGYLKPEEAKTIGSASRWVNATRWRLDVPHSYEIKLENVLIAEIATGMDEGSLMSEFVALTFSKTRRRYTQQRIGGGAAGCSVGGWDRAANAAHDGLRHRTQYAIHIHSTYMSDRGSRPKCAAPIRIVKLFSTLSDNFIYCQTFLCVDNSRRKAATHLIPPSPTSPNYAACQRPYHAPARCDKPAAAAPPRAGSATADHSVPADGSHADPLQR